MRRVIALIAVSVLILGMAAAPVAAGVDRIPVSFTAGAVDFLPPDAWWFAGNTYHQLGGGAVMRIDGHEYLDGYALYSSLAASTYYPNFIGNEVGTFQIVPDGYPESGWEGSGTVKRVFNETWEPLYLEMNAVGRGYGEFEGMQLRWVETWLPDYGDLYHRCEGYITVLP